MPGIPRSRACLRCKRRSVKCDQNWPTCTQCERNQTVCPGPSSLTKFVSHDGRQANHKVQNIESAVPSKAETAQIQQLSSTHIFRISQHNGRFGKYHTAFRYIIPPRVSGTASDRVAAQLVYQLESSPERRMVSDMMYLPMVAQHLGENSSLCDSVDLFCSAWAARRRKQPVADILSLPMYGKAIRSLSRALESSRAFTMDTVASIIILQKTEDLFNTSSQRFRHELGLTGILMNLTTLPEPGNLFESSIFCEIFGLLVPFWIETGWQDFMSQKLWRDSIIDLIQKYTGDKIPRAWTELHLDDANELCALLSRVAQLKRLLEGAGRQAQLSLSTRPSLIAQITNCYSRMGVIGDRLCQDLITLLAHHAKQTQIHTKNNTSRSEDNRPAFMGLPIQTPVFLLTLRLHSLRQRYEWSLRNRLPDQRDLHTQLSQYCDVLWEILPHMEVIDRFVDASEKDITHTEENKVHLLDIFSELETSQRLLSKG